MMATPRMWPAEWMREFRLRRGTSIAKLTLALGEKTLFGGVKWPECAAGESGVWRTEVMVKVVDGDVVEEMVPRSKGWPPPWTWNIVSSRFRVWVSATSVVCFSGAGSGVMLVIVASCS
jgi:hypothetical protein